MRQEILKEKESARKVSKKHSGMILSRCPGTLTPDTLGFLASEIPLQDDG